MLCPLCNGSLQHVPEHLQDLAVWVCQQCAPRRRAECVSATKDGRGVPPPIVEPRSEGWYGAGGKEE